MSFAGIVAYTHFKMEEMRQRQLPVAQVSKTWSAFSGPPRHLSCSIKTSANLFGICFSFCAVSVKTSFCCVHVSCFCIFSYEWYVNAFIFATLGTQVHLVQDHFFKGCDKVTSFEIISHKLFLLCGIMPFMLLVSVTKSLSQEFCWESSIAFWRK